MCSLFKLLLISQEFTRVEPNEYWILCTPHSHCLGSNFYTQVRAYKILLYTKASSQSSQSSKCLSLSKDVFERRTSTGSGPLSFLIITITKLSNLIGYQLPWFQLLYYYMRNFCNLIGLEQLYFCLIWNTYMSKLQIFCGW